MNIWRHIDGWREARAGTVFTGRSIGFVPTMGALHAGHLSLLERARAENDVVVMSLFVNPTQFNDPNDFEKYPQTLDADLRAAEAAGVDHVLVPDREEIYPDDYRYRITEDRLSRILEGAHRPGHFDGVLTVVMRLFNLVRPDRAYFGEKDLQQLLLIRGMVEAFFMPVEIVACPTVRAEDGLALSSRNTLLSPEGRAKAPTFSAILRSVEDPSAARAELERAGFEVDYVEDYEQWRLGAVRLEGIRLIDNVRRQ